MSPSVLAPQESGAQLLRLPADQFIERCLQSHGVTENQAKAFHAKFWRLHIDSQRGSAAKATKDSASTDTKDESRFLSSRDTSDENTFPFTERIRPGMAVRWNPPADFPLRANDQNLALVLCPQTAVAENVRDALGNQVNSGQDQSSNQRYLCAMFLPGTLGGSYEVQLWRQVVVDVAQMEAEVVLE